MYFSCFKVSIQKLLSFHNKWKLTILVCLTLLRHRRSLSLDTRLIQQWNISPSWYGLHSCFLLWRWLWDQSHTTVLSWEQSRDSISLRPQTIQSLRDPTRKIPRIHSFMMELEMKTFLIRITSFLRMVQMTIETTLFLNKAWCQTLKVVILRRWVVTSRWWVARMRVLVEEASMQSHNSKMQSHRDSRKSCRIRKWSRERLVKNTKLLDWVLPPNGSACFFLELYHTSKSVMVC